jgi:hypothetical protein
MEQDFGTLAKIEWIFATLPLVISRDVRILSVSKVSAKAIGRPIATTTALNDCERHLNEQAFNVL